MADERIKLDVKERDGLGSAETRRLRRSGYVPGVIYGGGQDPAPIAIEERELRRVLTGSHGLHAILDVTLDGGGKSRPSILKDYQQDPIRGRIVHFDLQEVRLDRPIQAQVVVELVGESPGVREGGVLSLVTREINVEALPMEVPDRIEVDISHLELNGTLRLNEVTVPGNVKLLDDPEETVVATVTPPTRVEEPEVEVEEGEEGVEGEAEGEEAAEGEAAAESEGESSGDESASEE